MRAQLSNAAMLALAACLATGTTATAQNFSAPNDQSFSLGEAMRATAASHQPYSTNDHHSSTAYGDVGKAVAAIMKAYTNGMIDLAKARVINEHADKLGYENSVNIIKAHNEREYVRLEHRFAMQQLKRDHLSEMQKLQEQRGRELAVVYLPRTLFDPATGNIFWPEAFSRPELAGFRQDMDALFKGLATRGPRYDYLYRDPISQGCDQIATVLKHLRQAGDLDWNTYEASIKMVRGLSLRAETWPENGDLSLGGSLSDQLASR